MNKRLQIYYHAIFGALGGLVGWWTMGTLATQTWNIWLSSALIGTGLGLSIGGLVAAADGAMIKRVPLRALRDGLYGAFAGALAGSIGLLIAEGFFLLLHGGFSGRTLGWMLLGLTVGLSDLAVSRRIQRTTYAALGGLAGGLIGGLVYEGLTQLFLAQSGEVQILVGGLGLVIVGACIGGLIPLARQVFSKAELRVRAGKQAGLVREVTESASLGRYDGNDLYLPDKGVSWRHAEIKQTKEGFILEVLAEAEAGVWIGANQVAPGQKLLINSGDQLKIGDALVEFIGR